jgi:polyhydroxybutyrate depolymerase
MSAWRLALFSLLFSACTRSTRPVSPLIAARPYDATVPSAIDPRQRLPLLVVLHGLGSEGRDIARYWQIDPLVDERGILVAYPSGTRDRKSQHPGIGHRQRFWNATDLCCDFFHSGVDDVAYLDAVIDDMSARFPVDPKRIFVGGISNGGTMAYRYACDRAERVAAIVSQAGAMWSDVTRCKPSAPVAVLQVHGTADEWLPYGGGPVLGHGPVVISAHQSVQDWIAFDGCDAHSRSADPPLDLVSDESPPLGAETTREIWSGCRGVELWTVHGGAHSPQLQRPTWARAIIGWLLAHPKP